MKREDIEKAMRQPPTTEYISVKQAVDICIQQINESKTVMNISDFQRLSRVFNEIADLRMEQDLKINEWLKSQMADSWQ